MRSFAPATALILALDGCAGRGAAPAPAPASGPGPSSAATADARGRPAAPPEEDAPASNSPGGSTDPASPVVANDSRWHAILQAIAGDYPRWGRVDDEMRFAPYLCRMPMPGRLRFSASDDPETHGEKLYSLYALDPAGYGSPPTFPGGGPSLGLDGPRAPPEALAAVEQALVKEAFVPEVVESQAFGAFGRDPSPALRDGVHYGRGDPAGLYVMFRVGADEPGTDEGWVYGTLAADGAVTSAGRVASCMGCHTAAPRGRLFGLPDRVAAPPGP